VSQCAPIFEEQLGYCRNPGLCIRPGRLMHGWKAVSKMGKQTRRRRRRRRTTRMAKREWCGLELGFHAHLYIYLQAACASVHLPSSRKPGHNNVLPLMPSSSTLHPAEACNATLALHQSRYFLAAPGRLVACCRVASQAVSPLARALLRAGPRRPLGSARPSHLGVPEVALARPAFCPLRWVP